VRHDDARPIYPLGLGERLHGAHSVKRREVTHGLGCNLPRSI
jgi:hypothetical protein